MEIDHGKLFVGGISWDTNEDRLRDYFQNFGDVIETVIMRDRATGRARGFGFVVFADPAVAERVVQEKHIIDGRNVEAKKAVPRDDQNNITRNPRSNSVSPGPSNIRTKKIFVGGLPSTITESDFKKYFDQFGLITDVVVMYDHNTQRPRGFGFITYDTEDAVDRALYKTFHELNGKMVEVKRAVPKELSPGPNRSPLGSYSPGLSRVSSFINGSAQGGYASSPVGNYGVRVDGRVSPGAIPTFVSLYGKGMHGEPNSNSSYGLNANFNPNLGYVKESNPLYGGISGREPNSNSSYGLNANFNPNLGYVKESNPLYGGISGRPANIGPTGNFGGGSPLLSLARGGLWGTESLNFSANSGAFTGSIGSENSWIGPYECIGSLWGSSSNLSDGIVNGSKFSGGNSNYGSIDKRFPGSYQKNNAGIGVIGPPSSYAAPGDGYDGSLDLYENGLAYGNPTWGSSPSRVENSAPLSYGLGNANADVMTQSSAGYVGYGMATVK